MEPEQILESLEKIVGKDFVSNEPEELFIYSQDPGASEPRPANFIVMPKTVDEIKLAIKKDGDIQINIEENWKWKRLISWLDELHSGDPISKISRELWIQKNKERDLVKDIVEVFAKYKLPTQVIAASLRHPQHCVAAAKVGAHIATVPYKVLMQMLHHPLTDIGIDRFLSDWKRVSQR